VGDLGFLGGLYHWMLHVGLLDPLVVFGRGQHQSRVSIDRPGEVISTIGNLKVVRVFNQTE
jgi:hypothetical protein